MSSKCLLACGGCSYFPEGERSCQSMSSFNSQASAFFSFVLLDNHRGTGAVFELRPLSSAPSFMKALLGALMHGERKK